MIRNIALLAIALTAGTATAAQIPVQKFTSDKNAAFVYTLPEAQTSSLLFDFKFSYTGKLEKNAFLGMWFNTADAAKQYEGPNFGIKANCGNQTCTNDVFVRTTGTNGNFVEGSDLKANTTYHLFGHLYKSEKSNVFDRFDIWLNPTSADVRSLTNPDASATDKSGLTSIETIGFRTANIKGMTMNVNEIRVGDVPEPGSVALMGLALAGLAFTRRNKRG